ncbi:MAG: response regulator transcription factor [Actinomycetota bacterium]|nr:response regulator transcription factor [Actinomycetota bacterium]
MRQKIYIYEQNKLLSMGLEKLLADLCSVEILKNIQLPAAANTNTHILIVGFDSASIEQIQKIRETHPSIKIIVLTDWCDEKTLMRLLKIPVQAVFLKSSNPNQIVEAINNPSEKSPYIDSNISPLLVELLRNPTICFEEEAEYGLTNREQQIISLINQGFSNQEIANHLFISIATVKFHLSNIYRKHNVKRRQDLIYKLANRPTPIRVYDAHNHSRP